MNFFASLIVKFFVGLFKDWRRDEALKEAGATEQRNENLEARVKSGEESNADFAKVDQGKVDLRDDL